ncbi:exodeoxyribonuclease 7 small subunit [Firmicutes bacterium CAG:882]|jgi:exodeoxyribonuclease VII small subunit|nr:exodeoxyribonuclease 7 small subunit [Firmicutes bacterium CAG:882]
MAKAKSIEENFEKLEEIIDNLEQNDMSLEEAFKAYEAGIRLTAQCAKQLDNVEKQIIVLREESAASNGDED